MKVFLFSLLALTGCHKSMRTPLTVEAYVWQSAGKPAVQKAMTSAAPFISTFQVRAAELRWTGREFEVEHFTRNLPRPGCGLVVRIGSSASQLEWTPDQIDAVAVIFRELARLGPKEIQCDYDCPQKRLAGYQKLLTAIQVAAGPVPVRPTTLPSWLDEPEFRKLIAGRDGYVLQVHSLQLPERAGDPIAIFNSVTARVAAEKAAALKVPFRIAMATYGCEVRFGTDGKVRDVISEDIGDGTTDHRAFALADPVESARLVHEWNQSPPDGLQGIIWYRLPVEGDRRNWPWETFELVIRGEVDPSTPELELSTGTAARDLFVVNRGKFPVHLPNEIQINDPFLAADGAGAYQLGPPGDGVSFIRKSGIWPWLNPGKKIPSGWLRFRNEPAHLQWSFKP